MSECAPFSVILVTGGCGFIPSNFINNLLDSSNAKVVNYDRLTPAGNKANVISSLAAPKQYVFIGGDICNRALLDRVLRRYDVDAVVHFAAQTHVCDSYKNPEEFVKCNTEGTVTLLEACRAYGRIKRFVTSAPMKCTEIRVAQVWSRKRSSTLYSLQTLTPHPRHLRSTL